LPIRAHAWTLGPTILHRLAGRPEPASEVWRGELQDPVAGTVHLSGRLTRSGTSGRILVMVHGLGGSHASFYAVRAAHAARRAGVDCLRLNLRGADRSGEDYYHAGLTADLRAALASGALAGYRHILLLGYSLGGHLVLRYATEDPDPRVRAAAAVCAPVDLSGCCAAIDRPGLWVYRAYLLDGLKRIYARVAERRPVPITPAQARRITTIRGWDDAIVAPRHGFSSAEDYYAKASVGPRLRDLKVPSLLVSAAHDPMVPWDTVSPWVVPPPGRLTVKRVDDGGHVGFPGRLRLDEDADLGLEPQVLAWLARTAG
jgi:uncharacterized protein